MPVISTIAENLLTTLKHSWLKCFPQNEYMSDIRITLGGLNILVMLCTFKETTQINEWKNICHFWLLFIFKCWKFCNVTWKRNIHFKNSNNVSHLYVIFMFSKHAFKSYFFWRTFQILLNQSGFSRWILWSGNLGKHKKLPSQNPHPVAIDHLHKCLNDGSESLSGPGPQRWYWLLT